MKKFIHRNDIGDFEIPERVEKDGKRYYVTPDGNSYPSITSILSQQENLGLQAWKEKVGEKEAKRISKEAARIESSKIFSKKLMLDNNIPTAYAEFFSDFDKAKEYSEKKGFQNIVIKADGLAAGKGVFLPDSNDEMIEILNDFLRKNKLGES